MEFQTQSCHDLSEFFLKRWTVWQSCPFQFRSRFRQATRQAPEARSEAVTTQDVLMEGSAWKMFGMLPVLLLRKPRCQGRVGEEELCLRFDKFASGEWWELLREAEQTLRQDAQQVRRLTEDTPERRAEAACQKVKLGEVSRARQCLTGASLAPRTVDVWCDAEQEASGGREEHPTKIICDFEPDVPVQVDEVPEKCTEGVVPWTWRVHFEHLKKWIDDVDTMNLLFEAVTSLAQARVPAEIASALMSARLTALKKPDGGVRGIATGHDQRL